jgi:hypothetical protein
MLLYLRILLTDPLFDTKSTLYTYTLQLCTYMPKNLVPGKRSGLPVEITYPFSSPSPCQQTQTFHFTLLSKDAVDTLILSNKVT